MIGVRALMISGPAADHEYTTHEQRDDHERDADRDGADVWLDEVVDLRADDRAEQDPAGPVEARGDEHPSREAPDRHLRGARDERHRDAQAGNEAANEDAAESVAVHALDPLVDGVGVDIDPARETMRHRKAPAPSDEVGKQGPGRRGSGAGEDDPRDLERIIARAIAVERDDEVARRGQRYARFLDRDDQIQRDELMGRDDAEDPTDRVGEERSQVASPCARAR
jgi:hypothetical protein